MKLKDLIFEKMTISVNKLAKEIGVSRPTICNILNGKGKPSLPTIKRICKYFNVDWHDYLED